MNQELQNHIKQARETGLNNEQIKQELLRAGWKERDINQSFTPTPPKKKFGLSVRTITLIVVASVIVFGTAGYGAYQYLVHRITGSATMPEYIPGYLSELCSELTEKPADRTSDWSWEYESKRHGFSIESLPVKVPMHKCNFDESVKLYKPTGGEVDYIEIKALEWEKGVYFYYDYKYKLERIRTIRDISPSLYEKCYKEYTIDGLLDKSSENHVSKKVVWNIIVKDINNEKELLDFIKERYSDNCVIGEKISNQNNIYDVSIDCQTPSTSYIVKYSPQNKKAATWMLGSDNKFFTIKNGQFDEYLDRKIEDSFKFIDTDQTTD